MDEGFDFGCEEGCFTGSCEVSAKELEMGGWEREEPVVSVRERPGGVDQGTVVMEDKP